MTISNASFENFLNKDIDLDNYVMTESMRTIHRWNLIGRWQNSQNLDRDRLCNNIETALNRYGPLMPDQSAQAKKNLETMKQKFGKYESNSGTSLFKAANCIATIDRIVKTIDTVMKNSVKSTTLPELAAPKKKTYFGNLQPQVAPPVQTQHHFTTQPVTNNSTLLAPKGVSPADWSKKPASNREAEKSVDTEAKRAAQLKRRRKSGSRRNSATNVLARQVADAAKKSHRTEK